MRYYLLVRLAILTASFACISHGKQIWAESYIGKKAPDLVVEKWLGVKPETTDKFLLIDFWATWCGPCRRAIPELNEIHRRLGERVTVIGISDETEEAVKKMKEPKIDYSIAIDPKARMKNKLRVKGIPHVILVDPSGVVRWEGFPLLESDPLTLKVVSDIVVSYSRK